MDFLINNSTILAHSFREARKRRGLSQAEAAALSGLLSKTVSLLENHPEKCSVETLLKHLFALNLEFILRDRPSLPDDHLEW